METIIIEGREDKEYLVLCRDGDYITFLLDVTEVKSHYMNGVVYEVTAWSGNETKEPVEVEQYMDVYIKWDGCSHYTFGEEGGNGYLHLCGAEYIERHCKAVKAVYEYASKVIEAFDEDELLK